MVVAETGGQVMAMVSVWAITVMSVTHIFSVMTVTHKPIKTFSVGVRL